MGDKTVDSVNFASEHCADYKQKTGLNQALA